MHSFSSHVMQHIKLSKQFAYFDYYILYIHDLFTDMFKSSHTFLQVAGNESLLLHFIVTQLKIYSYIHASMNHKKEFKYLQTQHKACVDLCFAANWPQNHNLSLWNRSKARLPTSLKAQRHVTLNRGYGSNSPPPMHGYQIPHPLEDSDNKMPSSPWRQWCQVPGVCPGEGCWSFELIDTLLMVCVLADIFSTFS